jgi:GH35 family endo-1,4-beta-xylanase
VLLGALIVPLASRAAQQMLAMAPGESLAITCDTKLTGVVQNGRAMLDCAAAAQTTPGAGTTTPSTLTFRGVKDNQVVSGTVAIEATSALTTTERVVFQLTGPRTATHTEKRAPFFFIGDHSGKPIGWDTRQFPDGAYALTATSYNATGATGSATVRFRVGNRANAATVGTATPWTTTTPVTQTKPFFDPTGATTRTTELEFGVAAHLFYIKRDQPLMMASNAGFGWIRQQIHWKDIEGAPGQYFWGDLDSLVEDVNNSGMKLMLSVVRSPSFHTADGGDGMPTDPESLGQFLAALATRYEGKVHAVEVWNEQNLAYENGGRVSVDDAGRYVELLKEAYTQLKAVDPSISVLAGPASSTGVTDVTVAVNDMDYYEAMYTYQNGAIRSYMDAQSVHPGGAANPPDTSWPDNPSTAKGWTDHPTFYFSHVENVHALMQQYGMGDTPIWITEFGWATENDTPGYEYGNQISYEEQAQYIVEAMQMTRERYPWVGAMFLWNLNFAPLQADDEDPNNNQHEQGSFSIVDGEYNPRPAYTAIQQYLMDLALEQSSEMP